MVIYCSVFNSVVVAAAAAAAAAVYRVSNACFSLL